jgi:hypothetical protein
MEPLLSAGPDHDPEDQEEVLEFSAAWAANVFTD